MKHNKQQKEISSKEIDSVWINANKSMNRSLLCKENTFYGERNIKCFDQSNYLKSLMYARESIHFYLYLSLSKLHSVDSQVAICAEQAHTNYHYFFLFLSFDWQTDGFKNHMNRAHLMRTK